MEKKFKKDTSFEKVHSWYDQLVGDKGSDYHKNVIIPNALKLLNPKKSEKILDIGCGQGVMCRELLRYGADVFGVDASYNLIQIAKKRSKDNGKYFVADAANLKYFSDKSFDKVTCIMAIQNMEPLDRIISEMGRVLKSNGLLLFVLNHPCFRIPRQSGWGFDDKRKLQYRRVDRYMSSMKIPIKMHPGYNPDLVTWTFHRPLSEYFENLNKNNFTVASLEEWTSHRKNQPGKNQEAENRSREEIPLFLAVLAVKSDINLMK